MACFGSLGIIYNDIGINSTGVTSSGLLENIRVRAKRMPLLLFPRSLPIHFWIDHRMHIWPLETFGSLCSECLKSLRIDWRSAKLLCFLGVCPNENSRFLADLWPIVILGSNNPAFDCYTKRNLTYAEDLTWSSIQLWGVLTGFSLVDAQLFLWYLHDHLIVETT